MSHRERPAPRGGPARGSPADRVAGNGAPIAWDDLYDRLPPDQRARVIAAAAHGAVPADQVPPPPAAPPPHLLHRLLADDGMDDLPPLDTSEPPAFSGDLDAPQQAAVALALKTPDIALVEASPGAGQDRVAAAAILGAAHRGERVLLVAASSAALDCALDIVANRPEVCCLRCVDRGETESDLSPAAANCIFAAHTRRLTEQARERALTQIAIGVEACRRRDTEAVVYDRLVDLAEHHHRLRARRAELPDLQNGISPAAELMLAEPTDADRERTSALARFDADLTARQAEAAHARRAVAALEEPLSTLRLLAAARTAGKWWTPAWWRARAAGDVTSRLAEVEAKHRQAVEYATATEADVEQTAKARANLAAERDRDRTARRQSELGRRRAESDDERVAHDREMALVADKWQQTMGQLPAAGPRPEELAPEAAAAARDAWGRLRDADRRDLDAARAWADGLEPLLEALPGRFLETVNLVAATPTALAEDSHFGDGRRGPFDLLIVLEAHALTDDDLLAAARRAKRWALIGEPTTGQKPGAKNGSAQSRTAGGGFGRLWQLLHCIPWGRVGERLVCRFRPVSPAGRGRLSREPVADRPDVELRIYAPTGGVPELAEVAFPRGMSVAQAVEYVFKELGELPACEGSDRLLLNAVSPPIGTGHADLGGGISAVIADTARGCELVAFEFDPSRWDHDRAATWAKRHVVRHGPGRTVRLGAPP